MVGYFLSGLLFLTTYLTPQAIVRAVHFSGNHAFSEHVLLDEIYTRPSAMFSPVSLEADAARALNYYREEGYYLADVHVGSLYSEDSSSVEVTFTVNEGEQVVIGEIRCEGNTIVPTPTLLEHFETHEGNIFRQQILEQDIQTLLSLYDHIGYPFANVSVQDISLIPDEQSPRFRITLSVLEGQKVTITEMKVQGNKETQEAVILRETRIHVPEIYDQRKVDHIPRWLNRLNIFSNVFSPELYVTSRGNGLVVSVEEGNTNAFDGVLGYLPADGGAEGYVTGMVNITMRNLFGTARKLFLRWQRDDRHSQEIDLRYYEPWLFGLPVNLGGEFFQRQQDSTYVKRYGEAKADVSLTDEFAVAGILNQENVIPSSTIVSQQITSSRTISAGVELRYDSRDNSVSPTYGVYYRSGYHIGSKKYYSTPPNNSQNPATLQKLSFDGETYIEPFQRQVVAFALHGRQITTDRYEISDMYRFGGATTLRGYRENQFIGSRLAWTNTEYRFLLARRSFFFGFFDTGYYFVPEDNVSNTSSTQNFKYGYGVGMRLETSLGNIGVSIALGEGDSFSQAKLHFGLINEF